MTTQAKPARRTPTPPRVDAGRWRYPALALAVLALCVVFHLYRLAQAPGWDPQEGYNLDIAWNLAHGRLRLFALTSDFAQHPPLFYLQLALAIRLLGYDIVAVRALAAAYAILTCGALLVVGRRLVGEAATLWGALVFTVAPVILANTRWGYTYAQLSFVGVLCLGATSHAVARSHAGDTTRGRRWLLAAAALAGLAAFSDYEGVAWVAFVALVAFMLPAPTAHVAPDAGDANTRHALRVRRTFAPLAIGLAIPLSGLLICFLVAPSLFFADWGQTVGRVSGNGPVVGALSLLLNYYTLVTYDPWLTVGLFGLLFLARPLPRLAPAGLRISLPRTREREDAEGSSVGHDANAGVGSSVAHDAAVAHDAERAGADMAMNVVNPPFSQHVGMGLGSGQGRLLPLALATLGLVTLATRPIGISFHTATPLLPLLALGAGLALTAATRIVRQQTLRAPTPTGRGGLHVASKFAFRRPAPLTIPPLPVGEGPGVGAILAALIVFLVVISPVALAGASDLAGLATTLPTRQDAILATPGDAQATARYIFAHAQTGDLVLASPEIAWMFDRPDATPSTQGADILQTLGQSGQAAAFYPARLPASRWAYPVALAHARYIVVDNLLRQLASPDQLPALIPILHAAERWPAVSINGQYTIYANPNYR